MSYRMGVYWMGVGGSWGTISGSLIQHQTTDGRVSCTHPQWGSSQTLGMWVGINLAAPSRVPAAPSGSQRHREDSVDNESSLWCVLQGPVRAEPGYSNEARASVWSHTGAHIWIHLYCPSHRVFFFFTFAAVWKDFTNHPESYSHYGNQGLSWPKYYFFLVYLRPQVRAVRTTCRFTWINEILNKTRVLSL